MDSRDWFRDQRWGVFTHFLWHEQNRAGSLTNMGAGVTDWNDCVDELNVRKLADTLHLAGAHYLIFTTMQVTRYMCAPNAAYDRITGYKPGEACARRDLIGDLLDALRPYGISLFLYFTGDGPYKDPVSGPAMGYVSQADQVTRPFVERWASVAREYSLRYGGDIRGWWVDGCYPWLGYNDELMAVYASAMKAGNPRALTAFNHGVDPRVMKWSSSDDYTCGEMNDFTDVPDSRFIDGAQWHTLAPLGIPADPGQGAGGGWCRPGCKRDAAYMRDYVSRVNAKGGVVTVDVALYRDGHLDPAQVAVLKEIDGQ